MATAMKYRGLAGAVIDASIRDTPQIKRLQFPVFSRGIAPSTSVNHYRFAGVNVPVTCAGVRVNPNDIIVADEDGVVVVPRAKAADVLKKAQEYDIPLTAEGIHVTRSGNQFSGNVSIQAPYVVHVDLPGYPLYLHFEASTENKGVF